ncbi:MAG: VOC family protein [Acidimicrobiales bacterium]|jgi:PhnB protein
MAKVNPVPDGYPRLSPSLAVHDGNAAIAFYCSVLGATERMRMEAPGGKVAHAELIFGDSVLMITDEFPEMGATSPKSVGGTPVTMSLYVDDVDDVFRRAIAEGATHLRAVEDQFYGDRSGSFLDPFGHRWYIATHIEDVPPEEMAERAAKAMSEY